MKMRFLEYLLEEKNLNENIEGQILIDNVKDAEEFFNKYESLKNTDITIKHIKQLYTLRDTKCKEIDDKKLRQAVLDGIKSRREPIIGNYKGEPGAFVFRKWVLLVLAYVFDGMKFEDPKFYTSKTKNKTLFKGFHNTNLKTGQTNTNSNWTPSAEEQESLICLAFNVNNESLNDKEKEELVEATSLSKSLNKNLISEDDISESHKAKMFYMDPANKEALDACVKPLFDAGAKLKIKKGKTRFDKQPTKDSAIKISEFWLDQGKYADVGAKPNRTPKTDIISNTKDAKISLKKTHGAQLMSGAYSESVATILTALYRTFRSENAKSNKWTEEAKALKDALQNKWASIDSPYELKELRRLERIGQINDEQKKLLQQYVDGKEEVANVVSLLNTLVNDNKEFKNNLLYEAITGKAKFGKYMSVSDVAEENVIKSNTTEDVSPAVANYVLVWSMENKQENKLYNIKDYITKLMSEDIKFDICYKRSSTRSNLGLRIVV